ncbi:hypothetical protein JOB18_017725 [Solea senegalensis]|uniref:MADF domain-containing protein n=1 Tax=Solea senegalensis TaxID=28829 RepID=A0AAV6QWB9_SOLSE|nr:hypothetical protein JOB18_017725 [Solea senegalensis]
MSPALWYCLPSVICVKTAFKEDVASRQEKTNNTWLKLAAALDPRFKDLKRLPKSEREAVWTTLGGMLLYQSPRSSPQTSENGSPKKKMSLLQQMGSDSDFDEEVQHGRDIHSTSSVCALQQNYSRIHLEPIDGIRASQSPGLSLTVNKKQSGRVELKICRLRRANAPVYSEELVELALLEWHRVESKYTHACTSSLSTIVCLIGANPSEFKRQLHFHRTYVASAEKKIATPEMRHDCHSKRDNYCH